MFTYSIKMNFFQQINRKEQNSNNLEKKQKSTEYRKYFKKV